MIASWLLCALLLVVPLTVVALFRKQRRASGAASVLVVGLLLLLAGIAVPAIIRATQVVRHTETMAGINTYPLDATQFDASHLDGPIHSHLLLAATEKQDDRTTAQRAAKVAGTEEAAGKPVADKTEQKSQGKATGARKTASPPKIDDGPAAAERAPDAQAEEMPEEPRPSWVGQSPHKQDGMYRWPLKVGPYATADEAEEQLLPMAREALARYATRALGAKSVLAGRASTSALSDEYIRTRMIGDDLWLEPVDVSFGRWVQLHVLLKFDRVTNERLRELAQQHSMAQRLWQFAIGYGAMVAMLTMAWGCLRVDRNSRGAYRWRMFALTTLVVVLLLAWAIANIAALTAAAA